LFCNSLKKIMKENTSFDSNITILIIIYTMESCCRYESFKPPERTIRKWVQEIFFECYIICYYLSNAACYIRR
jgi:hypothetical protein